MTLFHFHYLVTAFGLTVWTQAPTVVLAIGWAFQAVLFIAGLSVPDLDDFIFWQFITSLAGVICGVLFVIIARAPPLLRFRAAWVGAWGKFVLWLLFYLAAQLFYAFFPPPDSPFGLIGTTVSHIIVQVGLWVTMMYNPIIFKHYPNRTFFFLSWIVLLVIMELTFFLVYVILERWVAYVAAGGVIITLAIYALLCPGRVVYENQISSFSIPAKY